VWSRIEGDGRKESVTTPSNGLDVNRSSGRISQSVAQFVDRFVEALVKVDEIAIGPEAPLEFVARNDLPSVFEQGGQELRGLRL
jgi:hypothetical protein